MIQFNPAQQWTPIDGSADLLLSQLREQAEILRSEHDDGKVSDDEFADLYESLGRIATDLTKEHINPLPPP